MISRAHRSPLSDWWWTVDRPMLSLVLVLFLSGFVLSFAASPPVAERLGLDSLHFVFRHAVYAPLAAVLMIGLSFLTPRQVRRVALILLIVCLAMMVAVLFVGEEIKGSRRWLFLAGMSIQPSELIKPAFIVITAWLFAEGSKRPDVPGKLLAVALLLITGALLVAEPDLGQTVLFVTVWGALFFLAGANTLIFGGLGGLAAAGLLGAYYVFPHVAGRINRFLDPDSGDNFQIMTAMQSFAARRLVGHRAGRGDHEARAAGLPHRLRLRGRRRGVRHHPLPPDRRALLASRHARPHAGAAAQQRLRAHGDRRAHHADRHPGLHQHGREPAPPAGQGHDAALHLLWRLGASFVRGDDGLPAGAFAPLRRRARDASCRASRSPPRPEALARRVLLVAGGTGGHLFPALALREVLLRRGWAVNFATDARVGEMIAGRAAGGSPPHPVRDVSAAGRSATSARSAADARARACCSRASS